MIKTNREIASKTIIFRLLGYLRPQKVKLVIIFFMAVLSTVFSIVSPKILGNTTTIVFNGVMEKYNNIPGARINFEYILDLLLLLTVLYIISAFFSYLQQYLMAELVQNTIFNLRNATYKKLSNLPLSYFDSVSHGEILSRVTNDIDNISSTLQQSLTQLITAAITLLGILIMMLIISPLMTVIALVTLPLSFISAAVITKKSQIFFSGQQKELGKLNGHVEEMFTGHQIIKAFGQEDLAVEKFEKINTRLYNSSWKAQFISGIVFPMINLIGNIGYVVISVAGSILVLKKSIEIGDIQAFIQYSRQFTYPIMQTANIASIIQSTIASAERVFQLLDEAEETPEKENPERILFPKGEVEFDKVYFGYQDNNLIIDNLSIHVAPGSKIAIVGPTGAGKTTLVNLLMGFYDLNMGRILIDKVDIHSLKRNELRKMFGIVLQDTWLFNGSIRDNISYGKKGASPEQIINAAKAAHADHFIRTFPRGYDTVLDEEATNISQGQKQLLTIARAFLADPAILILDEATSNVDTRTELLIQKAMTDLMKGRTSFVIAHRLSTIKDADSILVMENGKIIETGSHFELLKKKGVYSELYYSQFTIK
ncbi:MAG: ABC transporter ATP-binding protein [Peptococcaceae bacterium]|nr:ABC transporter ATP-binding protein [Peptococcaceae bacterium]